MKTIPNPTNALPNVVIWDEKTYQISQRVEVYGSAEQQGIGTIVQTYNDRGPGLNITLYLVAFDGDDGGAYWTNETEMRDA